jgi:peptidoglycan/LPS O-acetylase OafA/YrhL
MFAGSGFFRSDRAGEIVTDIAAVCLAWSCALAAAGFARQYLNFDSRFRKLSNEAIYPFYLLHQPVIVILAHYIVRMDMGIIFKVSFLLISSFLTTLGIYWFLIRPNNFLRVIFGMKSIDRNRRKVSQECLFESGEYNMATRA